MHWMMIMMMTIMMIVLNLAVVVREVFSQLSDALCSLYESQTL